MTIEMSYKVIRGTLKYNLCKKSETKIWLFFNWDFLSQLKHVRGALKLPGKVDFETDLDFDFGSIFSRDSNLTTSVVCLWVGG